MRSKSRLIAVVASLLVCVGMVGTGFASWVILAESSADGTGNIQAETVNDASIKNFKVTVTGGDIVYGGNSDSTTTTGKWLVNDATAENLAATFKLAGDGTVGGLSATFTATTNWDTAVANKLITAPTLSIDSSTTGKLSISDADGTVAEGDGSADTYSYAFTVTDGKQTIDESTGFSIVATFNWGALFSDSAEGSGSNPYVFFNSKKSSDKLNTYYTTHQTQIETLGLKVGGATNVSADTTWKDYALVLLTKLNDLLTSTTYTFTFTATPVQAAGD